jgi:hypothetical protein
MPMLESSCFITGESCLDRLFPLAISNPVSGQVLLFCEGYEPNVATGEDSDGLLRFRRPEESEDESCAELSGDADETADRGWNCGLGLRSGLAWKALGEPKVLN